MADYATRHEGKHSIKHHKTCEIEIAKKNFWVIVFELDVLKSVIDHVGMDGDAFLKTQLN